MQHVSFYNFANIMRMLLRQTIYKNISEKSFTTVMEWMFKKKKLLSNAKVWKSVQTLCNLFQLKLKLNYFHVSCLTVDWHSLVSYKCNCSRVICGLVYSLLVDSTL